MINDFLTELINVFGYENVLRMKAYVAMTGAVTGGVILGILFSCFLLKRIRRDTTMKKLAMYKIKDGDKMLLYINPKSFTENVYCLMLAIRGMIQPNYMYTLSSDRLVTAAKRWTWALYIIAVTLAVSCVLIGHICILWDMEEKVAKIQHVFLEHHSNNYVGVTSK